MAKSIRVFLVDERNIAIRAAVSSDCSSARWDTSDSAGVRIGSSDGEDTASRFSRTEALEMVQRHDVTIYAISTNKTSDTKSREKVKGDEVIQLLADETGGKAYFPLKLDDLASDFQKIGQELRSQYILSYTPTNSVQDGTYRKIRVEMVSDKHKPRARKGYFSFKK